MAFLKLWSLIVIGLVIFRLISGKHFFAFSTAGFVDFGGLIACGRANKAAQPSDTIIMTGLLVAAAPPP